MKTNAHDQYPQHNPSVERNHEIMATSQRERSRWEDSNLSLININDSLNISIHDDPALPKLGAIPQQTQSNEPSCNRETLRISQQSAEMKENQSSVLRNASQLQNKDTSQALRNSESNMNKALRKDIKTKKRSSRVFPGRIESNHVLQTATSENRSENEIENIADKPLQLNDVVAQYLTEDQGIERIEIQPQSTRSNQKQIMDPKEIPVLERALPTIENEITERNPTESANNIPNTPSTLRGGVQDFVLSERNEQSVHPTSRQLTTNQNDSPVNRVQVEPQVRGEDQEANDQEEPAAQPTIPHLGSGPRTEVGLYLRKRVGLFGTFAVACLLTSMVMDNKVPLHAIVYPFYFYLVYLAVEGIIGGYKNDDIHDWQKRDHKLNTLTAISYIISLVLINLKLAGVIASSVLAAIPFCVITTFYAICTEAPDQQKFSTCVFKCLLCIQVVMITLKIDSTFDFDWTFVLIISLIYSGIVITYCLIYGIFIIAFFCMVAYQDYQGGNIGKRKQFMGLCWCFLYYGLSILVFLIAVGINATSKNLEDIDLLRNAAKVGFGYNLLMLGYTILTFTSLKEFIIAHFEIVDEPSEEENEVTNRRSRPTIVFRIEKENKYFVNLSSTYFLPLKRGLLAKTKPSIDRIKALLAEFTELKLRKQAQNDTKQNENKNQNKEKDIEALQKSKQTLDGKLKNILQNKDKCENCVSPVHKFLRLFSPKNFEVPQQKSILDSDFSALNMLKQNSKISLSVDNLDKFEEIRTTRKQLDLEREDEKLCYLCYANPPNSILMNCGHGGFCYECAIAAIQTKNECMECRAPVYEIHKIDTNRKVNDIVRAIEIRKVIVRQPVLDHSFGDY